MNYSIIGSGAIGSALDRGTRTDKTGAIAQDEFFGLLCGITISWEGRKWNRTPRSSWSSFEGGLLRREMAEPGSLPEHVRQELRTSTRPCCDGALMPQSALVV